MFPLEDPEEVAVSWGGGPVTFQPCVAWPNGPADEVTVTTWGGRRIRLRRNPADELPPLAPIEHVIVRACWRAEEEWRDEHGALPWEWPLPPLPWPLSPGLNPEVEEAITWPRRWFAERLFELPPLGEVPDRWHWLP